MRYGTVRLVQNLYKEYPMSKTDPIHECVGLSQELKKILAKAGINTFADIAVLTKEDLRGFVPKLKVRHLANLEHELERRKLKFVRDNSIKLDMFINQAKLSALWKQGITTYEQLDSLSHEEFVEAIGGPQSRFFRKKAAAHAWMQEHKLTAKKRYELPHLTAETAEILYKARLTTLKEVNKKSDFELLRILKGNMKSAGPFTRARLIEVRYALWKEGIDRPCKPL